MKKAKLEKLPWVKVKKKPGPKKVEKSYDEAKKLQLAESDKGSWYNQSGFLLNPSSSKDIGASRIKTTALAAEKFEDEKSDSKESNISLESEIEGAGDNPANFAVVDRLKISSEPQCAASCTDSGEKCVSYVNSAGAASFTFYVYLPFPSLFWFPRQTFPKKYCFTILQ